MTTREVIRRIGITEVEALTNKDRTTIRRYLRAGTFPEPEWIGSRRCWIQSDIEKWIAGQRRPERFNFEAGEVAP